MPNLMDSLEYVGAPVSGQSLSNLVQMARQNPQGFAEFVRQTNPQAYQQAMQVRNMANPQAVVREMARSRGLAPNILQMFGL